MSKIKKLLSLIIVVVMVGTALPISVMGLDEAKARFTIEEITEPVKDLGLAESSGKMQRKKNFSGDIVVEYLKVFEAEYAETDITNVTIAEGCEYIGGCAFAFCENLKTVTIPASVQFVDATAFLGCSELEKIVVDKNNKYYSSDESGILYSKDKTDIFYVPAKGIGNSYTISSKVKYIYPHAFSDCSDFELTLSENIVVDPNDDFFHTLAANYLNVDPDNPKYKSVDGVIFTKDGSMLVKYPVDSKRTFYVIPLNVTECLWSAFLEIDIVGMAKMYVGCTDSIDETYKFARNPKNLTVHTNMKSIDDLCIPWGATYMCDAFYSSHLENVEDANKVLEELKKSTVQEWLDMENEFVKGSAEYYFEKEKQLFLLDYIPDIALCEETHAGRDEVIITNVNVIREPNKTQYTYKSEKLDLTGLVLELVYVDGTKEVVAIEDLASYSVYGFDNTKTGTQNVAIDFEGGSVSVYVDVSYSWWQWLIVIFLFGWIWY